MYNISKNFFLVLTQPLLSGGGSNYTGNFTDYSKSQSILSAISKNHNKVYYSQLLDFVIETNKGLNKEWSKNGKYFDSKSDFYNAFLSDNYQQILKENKKR